MLVKFLPKVHAELNAIELLWSTIRACRYGVVVESAKLAKAGKTVGQVGALKHLLAAMIVTASPALISRHFRHVDAYKVAYRAGLKGPDAIAAVAAQQAGSRRTAPTDWETKWQSHWVPPFLTTIARREVRDGMAKCMRSVAMQCQEEQHSPDFFSHELVATAKHVLGPSGDAHEWEPRRVCVAPCAPEL